MQVRDAAIADVLNELLVRLRNISSPNVARIESNARLAARVEAVSALRPLQEKWSLANARCPLPGVKQTSTGNPGASPLTQSERQLTWD
jgi:hypothetical protein